MSDDAELNGSGSSRRGFLRKMAVAGLVGVPVVSSFSLAAGCYPLPGHGGGSNTGHGSNTGGGGNTTYPN